MESDYTPGTDGGLSAEYPDLPGADRKVTCCGVSRFPQPCCDECCYRPSCERLTHLMGQVTGES